ncbi:MAG: betaine/proline/choline family ABC transporter ATP-binding protein [Pararhodobacter sp.]|nr:betaine/proline/choline family ABC transporter ATP-binding protein [Pararhodobacter sp.]
MRVDKRIPAVVNADFDVSEGEIFVIMGLSGSGKSTLVRCLSRLIEPDSGEVLLDGDDILKKSPRDLVQLRRHKMGMVFQDFGLLPHLSVLENVAFPLKVQGVAETARRRRALEMIALVGLEGRESASPRELSGGQQQRVGIARSLAVEPDIWFLDEPFSALDPLIRRQMQDEFLRLQRMLNKTIVFITHDFMEALKLADRIAIMKDGEIVQIASPSEIVLNPASAYVADFASEVPLARVLTAADVMAPVPVTGGAGDLEKVPATMPLEELAAEFLRRGVPRLAVMSPETGCVGVVASDAVAQVFARPGAGRESA